MMRRMLFAAALIAGSMFGSMPSFAKDEKIAVIIKATDSDFWQYLVVGAKNYAHEHPGVSVTVCGAPSETDIEQQVSIFENVVTRHRDGILIAPSSSDAPADAIAQAMKDGIPVVTADNRVRGVTVTAHLATDNLKAGALAASSSSISK